MTAAGQASQVQPLLDLPRLVLSVRRRRRIWLATGMFGLLAGALLAMLMPAPPTAVTRLLVTHEHEQFAGGGALIRTDVAVLHTTRIAAAALKTLGLDERPEEFVETYEGVGLTNNVLELTVSGRDDRDAVARAQALADAFIADHVQRVQATADANAAALAARRDQAQAELVKVDEQIAAATAANRRAPATQLESLFVRRADLAAQVSDLDRRAQEASIGAPNVAAGTQIIDAPRAVRQSMRKAVVLAGGIGGALGLFIGVALAAVSSVVRERPVLRREIADNLGASVIAELPRRRRRTPAALLRRSRHAAQRGRVAETVVRAIRADHGSVSLLDVGATETTAALAMEVADLLLADGPVAVVDDLPGGRLRERAAGREGALRIVDSPDSLELPDSPVSPASLQDVAEPAERVLGVGSVAPGTAWTDLTRLGAETVLVVRAGHASTLWLHTVARQLADLQIPVIGVVLVDPDPRDRSDGTLWDGLHTALRGRASRAATATPEGTPAATAGTDTTAGEQESGAAEHPKPSPETTQPMPLTASQRPARWSPPGTNGAAQAVRSPFDDDYPTETFARVTPRSPRHRGPREGR